jgi:quinoprotein glucose dehydrogenase
VIRVTVVGATAGGAPVGAAGSSTEVTTTDGVRLRVEVLTDQLEAPTAMAFARDGRVFIAEREGRVRIWSGGRLELETALVLDDALVIGAREGGLLGLTLDPQFERTRFAYGLYTVSAVDGTPRFRLARFRDAGNRLGERVILLDGVAASTARPAGSIGVGPDGKVYSAFDDGGDPNGARALASYSGKVLRLNDDGTTPADQPAGSPVYSTDFRSPRGLDWHPVTRALWVIDAAGTAEGLRVIGAGPRSTRAGAPTSVLLPPGTGASSLAFYRGDLLPPFRGDLFVAAGEGRHLLRLRFDRRDSTRVVSLERILEDRVPDVRVVGVGPDGAVYICTDRALVRIGPA